MFRRWSGLAVDTDRQFVTILTRQRDHATEHHQPERAELFTNIITNLDNTA